MTWCARLEYPSKAMVSWVILNPSNRYANQATKLAACTASTSPTESKLASSGKQSVSETDGLDQLFYYSKAVPSTGILRTFNWRWVAILSQGHSILKTISSLIFSLCFPFSDKQLQLFQPLKCLEASFSVSTTPLLLQRGGDRHLACVDQGELLFSLSPQAKSS